MRCLGAYHNDFFLRKNFLGRTLEKQLKQLKSWFISCPPLSGICSKAKKKCQLPDHQESDIRSTNFLKYLKLLLPGSRLALQFFSLDILEFG